ncbi:hypothetical protein GCM10023214_62300 [Amycolatopsis dongchuanensis]|uniref:ChrB N-terminal domain-containing protein n=1 Tax=Amycolatopsis dongchuanensis TaxID=1070866 RepID=A0ABP8VER3_9PSEU
MRISASTAEAAGSLRTLGVLYLQQSVRLLPARREVATQMRWLAGRIRHQGGTAPILSMAFIEPTEEQAVVAECNAARDAEYAEVLERQPELRQEPADEQARRRSRTASPGHAEPAYRGRVGPPSHHLGKHHGSVRGGRLPGCRTDPRPSPRLARRRRRRGRRGPMKTRGHRISRRHLHSLHPVRRPTDARREVWSCHVVSRTPEYER